MSMADSDTDIPTMTIRPRSRQEGQGGTDPKAKGWDGGKLSYGDMVQKWKDRGYSDAGARGMADNMTRESSGDPTAIGPGGAAIGLFQHEGERRKALEAFAKERGTKPTDPDTQFEFADNELKRDYPKLREKLQNTTNRADAEDSFKRVFERPKSVLWAERPPKTETPDFRFSPYAMAEYAKRPNTDVVMMSPDDYLDLSPVLGGRPFSNPAGRSLLSSVDRGEPIEAIPTLDVDVDGNTGTVTDQDGRHRALLAKHAGVDAIPVAIQKNGKGEPTELVGQQGKILPNAFPKVEAPKAEKPRSMMQSIGDAIIPRAEAAEDDPYAKYTPPGQGAGEQGGAGEQDPYAKYAPPEEPDSAAVSAAKGAGAGVAREGLGALELAGKGIQAVGDYFSPPQQNLSGLVTGQEPQRGAVGQAGKSLYDWAAGQDQAIDKAMEADEKAHPWATGIGDFAGGMLIPGLGTELVAGKLIGKIGSRVARNALKAGVAGGVGGALEPTGDKDYWRDKGGQVLKGAAVSTLAGGLGDLASRAAAPTLTAATRKLMREGVELTPGQMAGGWLKNIEDKATSTVIAGSAIAAARQRSLQTFNRAAINRALASIGTKLPPGLDAGFDAIKWAEQQFKAAYNLVIPNMTGIRDPTFVRNLNGVVNDAISKKLPPDQVAELRHTIQTEILDKFDGNGRITGEQAQNIGTRLDEIIKPLRLGNVYQQQQARYLRDADKALDDMMATHNKTMQEAKDRIDDGWHKFKIVQRATKGTNAQPDGAFSPAQLDDAILSLTRSKDKASYRRGEEEMQDLARAGREVLPSKVGDSGTAGRAAMLGGLGAASANAFANDPSAVIARILWGTAAGLGASLPYSKRATGIENMIMNRLLEQPGWKRQGVSNALRAIGQGGAAGAGAYSTGGSIPTMTIRPGDNRQ
jgi:hypothetical protein